MKPIQLISLAALRDQACQIGRSMLGSGSCWLVQLRQVGSAHRREEEHPREDRRARNALKSREGSRKSAQTRGPGDLAFIDEKTKFVNAKIVERASPGRLLDELESVWPARTAMSVGRRSRRTDDPSRSPPAKPAKG